MLRLLGGAQGAWTPTEGGEERGILCRHAHSLFFMQLFGATMTVKRRLLSSISSGRITAKYVGALPFPSPSLPFSFPCLPLPSFHPSPFRG